VWVYRAAQLFRRQNKTVGLFVRGTADWSEVSARSDVYAFAQFVKGTNFVFFSFFFERKKKNERCSSACCLSVQRAVWRSDQAF
jgi:hypothetical protein